MKTAEELGLVFPKAQTLVQHALEFATEAHSGQVRKYTGDPYIVHPIEVAQMVYSVRQDVNMICAALLHDVIEDCGVTRQQIVDAGFREPIGDLVVWLTDVSRLEMGNRAERKAIDRRHTALAPPDAKTVKLADLISNSHTIIQHGKGFKDVYMNEKRQLLQVLQDGDPTLWHLAFDIVSEYFNRNPLSFN